MTQRIIGCGALFYTLDTQRFLLLHRTQSKQNHVWGLVGGTTTTDSNAWVGLKREIKEEIGDQKIIKTIPMETFISNDENFLYHTYLCLVKNEFIPKLNKEPSTANLTLFDNLRNASPLPSFSSVFIMVIA